MMMRCSSSARALLLAPRRFLDQSCRAFTDAAPEAEAEAAADAGESMTKSQRQKQAKAEAAAKAADAKPAPPDFIGGFDVAGCECLLYARGVTISSSDATLASFEQNGSRCARRCLSPLPAAARCMPPLTLCRSIQRTAAALSLDPIKVAAYVKVPTTPSRAPLHCHHRSNNRLQLAQIRQQRLQSGGAIDVTKSFTQPRSRVCVRALRRPACTTLPALTPRPSSPTLAAATGK